MLFLARQKMSHHFETRRNGRRASRSRPRRLHAKHGWGRAATAVGWHVHTGTMPGRRLSGTGRPSAWLRLSSMRSGSSLDDQSVLLRGPRALLPAPSSLLASLALEAFSCQCKANHLREIGFTQFQGISRFPSLTAQQCHPLRSSTRKLLGSALS
jgi:hypothetical protein